MPRGGQGGNIIALFMVISDLTSSGVFLLIYVFLQLSLYNNPKFTNLKSTRRNLVLGVS